jgi:hypothetical protein
MARRAGQDSSLDEPQARRDHRLRTPAAWDSLLSGTIPMMDNVRSRLASASGRVAVKDRDLVDQLPKLLTGASWLHRYRGRLPRWRSNLGS